MDTLDRDNKLMNGFINYGIEENLAISFIEIQKLRITIQSA